MSDTYHEWIEKRTADLIIQYDGELPPPWILHPEEPPFSMFWRMGQGDDDSYLWGRWWAEQNKNETERIAYFQKWMPPPVWIKNAIVAIQAPDMNQTREPIDYEPYFTRLEALGFPSEADFERDFAEARQRYDKAIKQRMAENEPAASSSKSADFWRKVRRAFRREPKEK